MLEALVAAVAASPAVPAVPASARLPFDDLPEGASAPAIVQLSERIGADVDSWAALAPLRASSRSREEASLV